MAKIGSTDLALVTARVKCCRLGAARLGFTPYDVKGPGATYPCEYMWREVKPPTTQWTLLTEGVVCGKRPVASFSNVLCNAVGPVSFTDTSTPADKITFWYWDFGDGGTSNDQNPTHTYAEGFFTVTLYVSSDKGTSSATGYVSVMSLSAGAAPNPVDAGVDVTFTPTLAGGLAPFTYLWEFDPELVSDQLANAWSLDEAAGDRVDTVGAKDLTPVGAMGNAAGKVGSAAVLTGTNYLSRAASGAELYPQGSYSISLWFYPTGTTVGAVYSLVSKNTGSSTDRPFFARWFYSFSGYTQLINISWTGTDGSAILAGSSVNAAPINTWNHLVFAYSTADKRGRFWLNGSAQTLDMNGPLTANPAITGTCPFLLGASNGSGTPGLLFEGMIDKVELYNKVLTDTEVLKLYGQTPLETFAIPFDDAGDRTISLTVTSASGCTATDTVDVTVNASTLAVTFVMDPNPLDIPVTSVEAITFTPTVTPGVAPYTFDWDFGDGTPHSTDEIPTHTFPDQWWTTTLTVTDANLSVAVYSETFFIWGI